MNHIKVILFVLLAPLFCGCSLVYEDNPLENFDDIPPRDTTRILAIGNSFSEDAVEHYLYQVGRIERHVFVIGNMCIAGCSLETHVKNARSNSADYSYRKIGTNGVKKTTSGVTLETALADEPWDYVSLQQSSPLSGQYNTFEAWLPELYEYMKERVNSNTEIVLHQTWAYAQDYNGSAFATYDNDQMKMYQSIVDSYRRAAELVGISTIISTGTAIQNARTSSIGDNMNRDGYHLNLTYGRFTAACTWYETFFGNIIDNDYIPSELNQKYVSIAHTSAHYAALLPNEVTQVECSVRSYIFVLKILLQKTFMDRKLITLKDAHFGASE